VAGGLVAVIGGMAEGGSFFVPGNGHSVRVVGGKQVEQDILEAENGVGVAPILGCQQLDTEVSPVHQTVAIQNQQFHTGTSEKTKHIDRNNKNSISQIALVWGVW